MFCGGRGRTSVLPPRFIRRSGRSGRLCPTGICAAPVGSARLRLWRCQHSRDRRRRDRGARRQQSKLRRLGAERALHDRSPVSKVDPVAHRPSTCTGRAHQAPTTTSYGWRAASRRTCATTATRARSAITSSVSVTNDTAWHTLVATWRPRRLELYLDGILWANSTAANTNTSDAFGIYRWWLGLLHQPGLQRRHRPDPVLRRLLDGPHGPPLARRPVRLPAPLARGACAHGECTTRHASLDRHGRGRLPNGVASNIVLKSNPVGMGRHVSGVVRSLQGHTDEFRVTRPAFRRLDRDHLEQHERSRCVRRGRRRGAGRRRAATACGRWCSCLPDGVRGASARTAGAGAS